MCLQVKAWLEDEKDVRLGDWKVADVEILNTFQLLTAKPVVYLVSFNSYPKDLWNGSLELVVVWFAKSSNSVHFRIQDFFMQNPLCFIFYNSEGCQSIISCFTQITGKNLDFFPLSASHVWLQVSKLLRVVCT